MSYNYKQERESLFTERGLEIFTNIRDSARHLLKTAGAFRAQECWKGVSGSAWTMLAALDRMVEMGELKEISPPSTFGQHRVFVSAKEDSL